MFLPIYLECAPYAVFSDSSSEEEEEGWGRLGAPDGIALHTANSVNVHVHAHTDSAPDHARRSNDGEPAKEEADVASRLFFSSPTRLPLAPEAKSHQFSIHHGRIKRYITILA